MPRRDAYHSLFLDDLSVGVRLGCTAEERAAPQEVRLSVEFRFETPPAGLRTDRLTDTICYAQVAEAMRAHLTTREFNLIEKIAHDCLAIAKNIAGDSVGVALRAHKVRPPVDGLLGGTSYRCGDFPA